MTSTTIRTTNLARENIVALLSLISQDSDAHTLHIELDKASYQILRQADLRGCRKILEFLDKNEIQAISEKEKKAIFEFVYITAGMSEVYGYFLNVDFPHIEQPAKIFKSPSTTPDPDRELTVLFNDGDILNKITWKNNKLRIDSNEIRGIVFFEKIKAWAYTDELLQAHNISLPEKETKAEPEAKAAPEPEPEPETSTVEPSTDDDKMSETQKMAIHIFDYSWNAMHKEEETPLTPAQQSAISTIDSLIANLLTMTPTEVREITKYLKQKLAEQQNS